VTLLLVLMFPSTGQVYWIRRANHSWYTFFAMTNRGQSDFNQIGYADRGPGSVVGIATGYGLDGPGIESRWGRDFPHLPRPALGPTQPPVQWVPGVKRTGRDADPSPPSSAAVMKR
jgi:hypothetical protein